MAEHEKLIRCGWSENSQIELSYHDTEWGVPLHDENKLFEFLILEGAQAGLSWRTILNKRENYRKAYDNFNPAIVARYDEAKKQELVTNAGIVRNRLKIESSIKNAVGFLKIQDEYGSFDSYIWQFVDGKPINNTRRNMNEIPASTEISDVISKELKRKGLSFVGSTIIYAMMQAIGMVNDHIVECFRYSEIIENYQK